jgi:formylglycine-generating enzyme required for sulfatase activity
MKMKIIKGSIFTGIFLLFTLHAFSQWLEINDVSIQSIMTEEGGPVIEISYTLNDQNITKENPAYVFIRISQDNGKTWNLIDPAFLSAEGTGLVENGGKKKILFWGSGELAIKDPLIRIRGLSMAEIPVGEFIMKSFPAGGKDPSISKRPDNTLPTFLMAINETTISMYVDFLNEMGKDGSGWNERMISEKRCGIRRIGEDGHFQYIAIPGRENYPVTYVSWYDAGNFLNWCGLSLPTEAMFEKAFVGGIYLDGDEKRSILNPNPERKYPWGDEVPYQAGIYRCNYAGDEDGFSNLAPIGSFSKFSGPYGINDLAGNVSEWTLDWYSTTYHIGLDGFRMIRGGSWLAEPFACDAVSGATQFPIKESSIMGFRGVYIPQQ